MSRKAMAFFLVLCCLMLGWAAIAMGEKAQGQAPQEADLDADGVPETLCVEWIDFPETGEKHALVRVADAAFETEFLVGATLLPCDLDPSDARLDLLVSGDLMSDDYATLRLQYWDGALRPVGDMTPGQALSFENGQVLISDWVDVLGTRGCVRPFVLDPSGALVPAADQVWQVIDPEDMPPLTLTRDLPVTFLDASGARQGYAVAGERLMLTATDAASRAWFAMEDGRGGYIEISPNAEPGWGWSIAGESETTYFEYLPYAG